MPSSPYVSVVVPCAGAGERMSEGAVSTSRTKLFLELTTGRPVIVEAISSILASDYCDHLTLAVREQDRDFLRSVIKEHLGTVSFDLVVGGSSRQESVALAIASIEDKPDYILVHDAARPLCSKEDVDSVCQRAFETGAAILASPVTSTVKISESAFVDSTIDRTKVWLAQTPQVFSREILLDSLAKAKAAKFSGTDESSVVEFAGYPVAIVKGSSMNIKLTEPDDLKIINALSQKMTH